VGQFYHILLLSGYFCQYAQYIGTLIAMSGLGKVETLIALFGGNGCFFQKLIIWQNVLFGRILRFSYHNQGRITSLTESVTRNQLVLLL